MAQRIDGKAISDKIRQDLKGEIDQLTALGVTPGLAVILVGDDPASQVYVRNKGRACEAVGIRSQEIRLSVETTEAKLLAEIDRLNADTQTDGILVQLPLPLQIDEAKVIEAIHPAKDVDGFHPYNVGRMVTGDPTFQPCTPYGVMKMLDHIDYDLAGKEVVVIGRSNIVGKPVAMMCLARSATVTVCHSRTRDLPEKIRQADVVIAAVGRPEFVQGDWIKPGAVVIDVGINRSENGTLVGDVDFEAAATKAAAITPVPGGVGPMTITMLLYNTLTSARQRAEG